MAERKTPSKGGKPDKLFRDALMVAVKRECEDTERGGNTTKLKMLAAKVVEMAIDGNTPAAVMIRDSLDGKPTQEVDVHHEGEVTFRSAAISAIDELIAGAAAGSAHSSSADPLPN